MIYRFTITEPETGTSICHIERECTSEANAMLFATVISQKCDERFDIYIAKQLSEDSCGPVKTFAKLLHRD